MSFFSETTWPFEAKFHVGPQLDEGTKVFLRGSGHMTKMPPCPYMVKTPQKSSPEPLSTKLCMYPWVLGSIIVCSNYDPGMTLTYFMPRSYLVTWAFECEKVQTVNFKNP